MFFGTYTAIPRTRFLWLWQTPFSSLFNSAQSGWPGQAEVLHSKTCFDCIIFHNHYKYYSRACPSSCLPASLLLAFPRTIDVLLSAGADASAEGPGGALALDAARMAGFDDACALLKKHSRREDAQIAERRKALGAWLESLGCGEFLWRLLRAGYDDLYFMAEHGLTEEDLDCVGVPKEKLGLRKKLLVMHGVEEFLDKLPGGKGTGAPGSGTENASTAKARSGKTDSNEEDSSFNGNSSVAETDRGKSSEESSDSSSDDSDSTTSS